MKRVTRKAVYDHLLTIGFFEPTSPAFSNAFKNGTSFYIHKNFNSISCEINFIDTEGENVEIVGRELSGGTSNYTFKESLKKETLLKMDSKEINQYLSNLARDFSK